jgi:2-dehydro-3-deoxyphosphogluconate aldolase/(4S)-4-hydroxy-2-oxoglutarate aldolase
MSQYLIEKSDAGENMSDKDEVKEILRQTGVVAIIRLDDPKSLIDVSRALSRGGVKLIEITMTTPGALETLQSIAEHLKKDAIVGAGTILDAETTRAAIMAGAQFVVSPVYRKDIVTMCHRYSVVVISGALTPTEVLSAWDFGADAVKVFPARFGGAKYLQDLKGPLPQVELIPTGGINLKTAPDFIRAGASAVGVGGALIERRLIQQFDFEKITDNAREFIQAVQVARS